MDMFIEQNENLMLYEFRKDNAAEAINGVREEKIERF